MSQPRPRRIELDANASVPPLPEVRDALLEALTLTNPSAPHAAGRAARRRLDEARAWVAKALGGEPRDLIFTSGATEANRWLVDALVERGRSLGEPLTVVTTPLEHPSVRAPLEQAADRGGVVYRMLPLDDRGAPALSREALAGADAVFSTGAHNETGILTDLELLCDCAPRDALVLVDAAQLVARGSPVPARVDGVVASAHKIGGVAGAGALLLRGHGRRLRPPWAGPGQEQGLRPGTEPVPAILAFGRAAELIDDTRRNTLALAGARDELERRLLEDLDGITIVGSAAPRLPQTSAVTIGGVDGDALRLALDRAGLGVGFGAACSSLAPGPSPALEALGLGTAEARATIRISLAPSADPQDLAAAAARLVTTVLDLRARAGTDDDGG